MWWERKLGSGAKRFGTATVSEWDWEWRGCARGSSVWRGLFDARRWARRWWSCRCCDSRSWGRRCRGHRQITPAAAAHAYGRPVLPRCSQSVVLAPPRRRPSTRFSRIWAATPASQTIASHPGDLTPPRHQGRTRWWRPPPASCRGPTRSQGRLEPYKQRSKGPGSQCRFRQVGRLSGDE